MCDIIHVTSSIPCGVDHSCVTSSAPCDIMPTPCDTTTITIVATLCWATHPGQPRPSSIIVSRAAEEPQCWAGRVPGTSLFPGLLNNEGPSQLRASLLRGGFVAQTSSHRITALLRGKRNPPALSWAIALTTPEGSVLWPRGQGATQGTAICSPRIGRGSSRAAARPLSLPSPF